MSLSRLLGSVVRENPGIQVILLANGNGHAAPDDEDYEDPVAMTQAPAMTPPPPPWGEDAQGDETELQQLRAQVQSLTSQLAAAQAASPPTATEQVPAEQATGLNGALDDHNIDVLGIEDEKLENKLNRLGYDTVGKLRAALLEGTLAEAKLKKDWLIEVGMRLAGARPSGGAGPAPAPAAATGGSAGDVPDGHTDRPWLERLAVAKQKQATLDQLRADLATKQEEVESFNKKNQDIPEALDEDIINLEESIGITNAHLASLRWGMGLNPDTENLTLDEALQEANLGPWMGQPQPRLAPA